MSRVRIEFLKGSEVIKRFDRTVRDQSEAAILAEEIASDSGIDHDSKKITMERKFKALLLDAEGKRVELIESKAFDAEDAKAVAEKWAKGAGVQFTSLKIQFLEA